MMHHEAAQILQTMADQAPVLLRSCDQAGHASVFNASWLYFTGRTSEVERDLGWTDHIHPSDYHHVMKGLRQALQAREPLVLEYRLKNDKGQFRWLLEHASPLTDAAGGFQGLVSACLDITERKKAEAARDEQLKNEKLAREEIQVLYKDAEEANQRRDLFLATVSHELRTPMNAIVGWSSLLATGQLEPDDYRLAIQTIERNANAQNKLIHDLLDMSAIATGTLSLELKPLNVGTLVHVVVESLATTAAAKKIELRCEIEDDVCLVAGDAGRLQQVIGSVVGNALKFSGSPGDVVLKVQKQENHLVMSVTDKGCGIAKDALPFIFDRFRRHDGETMRRESGLGTGLVIARHLVELHGGRLSAHSSGPDQGATFSMTLPLIAVASAPAPNARPLTGSVSRSTIRPAAPSQDAGSSLTGLRVLIVDDQVDVLSVLKLSLSRHGADVVAEDNVTDALEQYRCFLPHIIISDIGMPHLCGYDFVRSIRELEASKPLRTPIIALTAHGGAEERKLSLEVGFDLHLTKPVEPDTLVYELVRLAMQFQLTFGEAPRPSV